MNTITRSSIVLAICLGGPSAALAHPSINHAASFQSGLIHPFSGADHILAMVMVGVFAFQLGGRARWMLPVAFLTNMIVGAMIGMTGHSLPFIEGGIAFSVFALGVMVAFASNVSLPTAMGIVSVFAIFHGFAHGSEFSQSLNYHDFAAGFVTATALLHIAGIAVAVVIERLPSRGRLLALRSFGGFSAAAGCGMLAGLI